ncbi:phosphatidate cytidylyltransferase [Mycoplasma hafezii]|uniref:phosphatidate cytidylyltransferase n=1 Tax=Mycoplasma hafezii TaxID=525886 RepID=UPI003CEE4AD8
MDKSRLYTNDERKELWKDRVIPAVLLVIGFLALLVISRISFFYTNYQTNLTTFWVLRIVSLVLWTLFGLWVFYELNKAFLENKIASLLLSFISLGMLFLSPNWLLSVLLSDSFAVFSVNNFAIFKNYLFIDSYGLNLILIFTITVFYSIFRMIVLKNNYIVKELIIKACYYFVALFVLNFLLKGFILLCAFNYGLELICLVIVIAMSSDIGGFFGGRFLGHKWFDKKLAPNISPKKTIEGAIVGYITAILMSLALVFIWQGVCIGLGSQNYIGKLFTSINWGNEIFIFWLFIILAPFFAIIGDLYFSLIKRKIGIKDYSHILRGHGGILDRVDSISFIFTFLGICLACVVI